MDFSTLRGYLMTNILKFFLVLFSITILNSQSLAVEAYPVPRYGSCPSGYHASSNYCVPNNFNSGAAVERDGSCPSGYHASGNYCVANNASSGKAIYRNGSCPSGYHASGRYCIEN